MNIAKWLDQATSCLQSADITTARLDAMLLLADTFGENKSWILAHDDMLISLDQQQVLTQELDRRLRHEPLAYIRKQQEFYGRNFYVDSSVLIPRPDSESLIELFLQLPHNKGDTLIDVGTGSGALAITTKLEAPEVAVTACDISPEALTIARKNAAQLHASITFVQNNLLKNITNKSFDFIIANLPYVDHSWKRSPETSYEPPLALFAEDTGLALIKKLIIQAAHVIRPNGHLLLEADPRQHAAITLFSEAHNFTPVATQGFALIFQQRLPSK